MSDTTQSIQSVDLSMLEEKIVARIGTNIAAKVGRWAVGVIFSIIVAAAAGASAWANNTAEVQTLKDKALMRDRQIDRLTDDLKEVKIQVSWMAGKQGYVKP